MSSRYDGLREVPEVGIIFLAVVLACLLYGEYLWRKRSKDRGELERKHERTRQQLKQNQAQLRRQQKQRPQSKKEDTAQNSAAPHDKPLREPTKKEVLLLYDSIAGAIAGVIIGWSYTVDDNDTRGILLLIVVVGLFVHFVITRYET